MIKVLIADDSALMRRMLRQIIESDPEMQVIGIARDGEDVVIKAREYRPDVITMDVNMPKQDGITALQYIVNEEICPVLMVSSLTQEGAMTTFEALELGAFDFVGKPGGTISSDMEKVAAEIIDKLKAAVYAKNRIFSKEKTIRGRRGTLKKSKKKKALSGSSQEVCKAVAMGISTGGPKMIYEVVPLIPADINAALFLVQHMPPNFTPTYIKRLNEASQLEVIEARAGTRVEPGVLYVGGGGRHLNLVKNASGDAIIRLSSKPDHLFIPSVSLMMESVLRVFGNRTIGVLMTGMGTDGADGMVNIRQAGGITIAESEESAIVYGMPGAAVKSGGADIIVPIWDIAREIMRVVNL